MSVIPIVSFLAHIYLSFLGWILGGSGNGIQWVGWNDVALPLSLICTQLSPRRINDSTHNPRAFLPLDPPSIIDSFSFGAVSIGIHLLVSSLISFFLIVSLIVLVGSGFTWPPNIHSGGYAALSVGYFHSVIASRDGD